MRTSSLFLAAALFLGAGLLSAFAGTPAIDWDTFTSESSPRLAQRLKGDPRATSEYEVHNAAIWELQHRLPDPDLVSALMALLEGENHQAQQEAVKILVHLRVKEVTPFLVTWLAYVPTGDPGGGNHRRTIAFEGLQKLVDPASLPVLIEYFRSEASYGSPEMVLLAQLGAKELLPEFKANLGHRLTHRRANAVRALAILGDKSGRDVVRKLLKEEKNFPGEEDLAALVELADRGDQGLLEELAERFAQNPRAARAVDLARFRHRMMCMSPEKRAKELTVFLEDLSTKPNVPGEFPYLKTEWAFEALAAMKAPGIPGTFERVALGNGSPTLRELAYHQLLLKGIRLGHRKTGRNEVTFFKTPLPGKEKEP